jgi:hypothetical protein
MLYSCCYDFIVFVSCKNLHLKSASLMFSAFLEIACLILLKDLELSANFWHRLDYILNIIFAIKSCSQRILNFKPFGAYSKHHGKKRIKNLQFNNF